MSDNGTVITTLISVGVSTITLIYIMIKTSRDNQKTSLDNQLNEIINISIQYPYLDSRNFANNWVYDESQTDETLLRYESYCVLVFNYMSKVADFYCYKIEKIEKFVAFTDWARMHSKYWNDPKLRYENIDSYDSKFVELINGLIK